MAHLPVQDLQEAESESEVPLGSIWLTFSDSSMYCHRAEASWSVHGPTIAKTV